MIEPGTVYPTCFFEQGDRSDAVTPCSRACWKAMVALGVVSKLMGG